MCTHAEEAINLPELEWQAVLGHLVWVLGTRVDPLQEQPEHLMPGLSPQPT